MDRNARSKTPGLLLVWLLLGLGLGPLGPGCATMGNRAKPLVPTDYMVRTGPYQVWTNGKLEADAPVIRQLKALESQVQETLGLRVDAGENPVQVYILDDRKAFEHFLLFYYPDLPQRRAFFLANGPQRVVYTFFGDRLEEDVRHEATHALLHLAVGDIPLWLDEGLAEYFESPTQREGVNPEHVARLPADLAAGWSPDLARMESLKAVRQMSPRDYRESWAWVHYLLNDSRANKTALLAYLADLRTSTDAQPLSRRLEGPTAGPMLTHLEHVHPSTDPASAPVATANAPRDPTIRLQSAPPEPVQPLTPAPAPVPKRKSLLARMFGVFGP